MVKRFKNVRLPSNYHRVVYIPFEKNRFVTTYIFFRLTLSKKYPNRCKNSELELLSFSLYA